MRGMPQGKAGSSPFAEGLMDVFEDLCKKPLSEAARQGWRTRRARANQNLPSWEAEFNQSDPH